MWPQSLESKDKNLVLPLGDVPASRAGVPAPLQPRGTVSAGTLQVLQLPVSLAAQLTA